VADVLQGDLSAAKKFEQRWEWATLLRDAYVLDVKWKKTQTIGHPPLAWLIDNAIQIPLTQKIHKNYRRIGSRVSDENAIRNTQKLESYRAALVSPDDFLAAEELGRNPPSTKVLLPKSTESWAGIRRREEQRSRQSLEQQSAPGSRESESTTVESIQENSPASERDGRASWGGQVTEKLCARDEWGGHSRRRHE